MQAESPAAQFAGLSLNQEEDELPEYISSGDDASAVGSSVTQQNKNTIQVNAEMVDNAVAMIQNLAQQVLTYCIFS